MGEPALARNRRTRWSKAQVRQWGEPLLFLAERFLEAETEASNRTWKAVGAAWELRRAFPVRVGNGKSGWMEFCRDVLPRSYQTLAVYIKVAKYCDERQRNWRERASNREFLPPVFLVYELSGKPDCKQRRLLHRRLFSGSYESYERFRQALDSMAVDEFQHRTVMAGKASRPRCLSAKRITSRLEEIKTGAAKACGCPEGRLSCISGSEWLKAQLGVWQFHYEKRDIRDKDVHPAAFPIALASRVISLFTHRGELVLDPFVGSGTTLVGAADLERPAVGFDLQQRFVNLANSRLAGNDRHRVAVNDDARNIPKHVGKGTAKLIFTSPPYADILEQARTNRTARGGYRKLRYGKVDKYSDDNRDLGNLRAEAMIPELGKIFTKLRPLLVPGGHVVIDILDVWRDGVRHPLHADLIRVMEQGGYRYRNLIVWDKRNLLTRPSIFGYPSNFIAMASSFELLVHFVAG